METSGLLEELAQARLLIEAQKQEIAALKKSEAALADSNVRIAELYEELEDAYDKIAQSEAIADLNNQLNALNEELSSSNEELTATLNTVKEQNELIEKKTHDILSSFQYASRIQIAMLPQREEMQGCLADHFIYFKPRDIVSGDCYWYQKVYTVSGKARQIFAVIDCTGHGVPGAFMSVIANNAMDEIVSIRNIYEPDEILFAMHEKVTKVLNQVEGGNKDGMDMSVCVMDPARRTMEFAGARSPLLMVSIDEEGNKSSEIIKADPHTIGGMRFKDEIRLFTKYQFAFKNSEKIRLYMFTDGYKDQFGGPESRKFMANKFREMLEKICHLPMDTQREILDRKFIGWKGKNKQIDDILVAGFEF